MDTSTSRGRRGKTPSNKKKNRHKNKGSSNVDKGKERESELRQRATGGSLSLEINSPRDADGKGGEGIFPPKLPSGISRRDFLRKSGGSYAFLPSSDTGPGSFVRPRETLEKILSELRADEEEERQVRALIELSHILLHWTDDHLSTFSLDSFVPLLVGLLNYENNPDIMLLAAKVLSSLSALPSSCDAVVRYGAVPCFVARLQNIEYMDLAEQSLEVLKKISNNQPSTCLRAGALTAVLVHLDSFPTGVQRDALSIAANICKELPPDAADFIMEAVPLLTNLLQYHDAEVIEHASICMIQIVEAFASSPEKLDDLCSHGIVTQVAHLFSSCGSGGGHISLKSSTYTGLIRLLSTFASGSSVGAKSLLLLGISGILKDLLLGPGLVSSMSASPAFGTQLEQVFEIVNLANELLPPFPQRTISVPVKQGHVGSSSHQEDSTADIHTLSTRAELLNEQPVILQHFGMDLLPVLIQIYGSGVNGPVHHKCLSIIGKIMYFSTPEMTRSLIIVTNISSFLAGVLACKDPQVLVLALQIAEILMEKLPDTFSRMFFTEGVVHAVDALILTVDSSTSRLSSDQTVNDSIPGPSSCSTRSRSRVVSFASIANAVDPSEASCPSIISPPHSVEISAAANSSLRVTVSAHAKKFKEKYFSSEADACGSRVTHDLPRLKNLCTSLNMGIDKQKTKSKGLSNIFACEEDHVVDVITDVLRELFREDGVSNFEFIDSGVVSVLLGYFTCGWYLFKERISEIKLPRLRLQAIRRYNSFLSLALPSNIEGMSILVRQLQNALSSLDCFPIVLSHKSRELDASTRGSSGSIPLSQSIKLHLRRAHGEKTLRDYSTVLLVDPLTSLADIEDFLLPKVEQYDSGEKPSLSEGNSWPGSSHAGETTSRSPFQENDSSSSKSMGKELLSSIREDVNGPQTRSAVCRRSVFDQDNQVMLVYGDTFSEVPKDVTVPIRMTNSVHGLGYANDRGVTGGHPSLSSNDQPKLIFTAGGRQLNRQMTVYQAIQQQLAGSCHVSNEQSRTDIYTMLYQRAEAKGSSLKSCDYSNLEIYSLSSNHTSLLDSILPGVLPCDLESNNPAYDILALLRLLEGLNQLAPRFSDELNIPGAKIPQEDFVNHKLSSKLAQQIQNSVAYCTESLPPWCYQLAEACPFLFAFEVRRQYFYSTAFGCSRAFYSLQFQQDDKGQGLMYWREKRVSRLPHDKVRVSRDRILASAAEVMEMYSSKKSVLEVEYFGDVGTGLGPTLEFYTLLSHELQKAELGMWRSSLYTDHMPLGLFPRPRKLDADVSDGGSFHEVIEYFQLLGRVMAKALQDGRILDLPLSAGFYKLVLGQELDLHDIISFDAELGTTLQELGALVCRKEYLEAMGCYNLEEVQFRGVSIQDLCLDFSLPGYPEYILKPSNEIVDISTLGEYISLVVDATVGIGITRQMEAFRRGFNQVFDISTLRIFSPNELDLLLCGCGELWEAESLVDHIKFDHGYTSKSPAIINLLEIMGEFTLEQQRAFCQFVTGVPRLPPGGLARLNPKLTVVRKLPSNSARNCSGSCEYADEDLPSVTTCANYLKLPPYSSKEIMYKKLLYAITEGQESFDLS